MNAAESELKAAVDLLAPDAVALRHHLHAHPELSGQEAQTAALVAEKLREMGVDEVQTNVGGHGVIGTLHGAGAGAENGLLFAIRADMDALPIAEENDVPYKSCNAGVMHACGHDGHTATLLGTAALLARRRETLSGRVRFIFQPAEETVRGAEGMCEAGAMEGVSAIVALHAWPGLDVGQIALRSGPMMASSDTFDLTIRGQQAHAAMPHKSVDPILIAAQIVVALQSLSSREISPTDAVVVTVAQFHAGTAHNIIPGKAELRGTVRCLSPDLRKEMASRIERIVSGVCAAFRAEYEFRYTYGTPVTTNDPGVTQLVRDIGSDVLGATNVVELDAPSMGAEDFAVYLGYAPGAMFRLGVGADSPLLHTPTYNFADGAVSVGMELFARTACRYLESQS